MSSEDRSAGPPPPEARAAEHIGDATAELADLEGDAAVDDRHPLAVLLGGPWGAVESMAPTVLFVAAYLVSGRDLGIAVIVALVVAGLLAVARLVRKEKPVRVLSGLIGVGAAALFAAYMGRPEAFFEVRVLANIVSAAIFAISIFIKRPLMGVIMGPVLGTGMRWRKDPDLVKAYSRVTWLWVALSLVRAAIQVPLILAGQIVLLGATPFLFYGLVAITIVLSWRVLTKTLPPGHPGVRHPRAPAAD